jgi:hypothetical protein
MIDELNLWAAQDALLAALAEQAAFDIGGAGEVAIDLGFPRALQPRHVWIDGGATGRLTAELTAAKPSDESFTLSVFILVVTGDTYADARTSLIPLAKAVEDALASERFAAVVPAWSIPSYTVDSGTDGTNYQVALKLDVECRCW